MHEYVTFPDETTVAFSDLLDDGTVEVLVERPTDDGFDTASYSLPSFVIGGASGFSDTELDELSGFVARNAPIITSLARENERMYA